MFALAQKCFFNSKHFLLCVLQLLEEASEAQKKIQLLEAQEKQLRSQVSRPAVYLHQSAESHCTFCSWTQNLSRTYTTCFVAGCVVHGEVRRISIDTCQKQRRFRLVQIRNGQGTNLLDFLRNEFAYTLAHARAHTHTHTHIHTHTQQETKATFEVNVESANWNPNRFKPPSYLAVCLLMTDDEEDQEVRKGDDHVEVSVGKQQQGSARDGRRCEYFPSIVLVRVIGIPPRFSIFCLGR